MPGFSYVTATISNGQSLSGAIDLASGTPTGIQMPAAWDAATLTFQGSADGVTYQNLYDAAGVEVAISAAAARFIELMPDDFAGLRYLKVRSGTSATPVNQTANRIIQISIRF